MTKRLASFFNSWTLRVLVASMHVQFGYHFWPTWAHMFGIRVDYFSPTIYFTDILLLVFVSTFYLGGRSEALKDIKRLKVQIFILVLFFCYNIIISQNFYLSLFKWVRVFEFIGFVFVLSKYKFHLMKDVFIPLTASLFIVGFLGICQVIKGASLGGVFYLLGERAFSISTPGIAKVYVFGRETLRAYSTFSHPNSLAGYLLLCMSVIFLFHATSWGVGLVKHLTFFLAGIVLFLTFSKGAFVALAVGVFFYLIFKRNLTLFGLGVKMCFVVVLIASILLPVGAVLIIRSWPSERLWLSVAAGQLLAAHPEGVGLNNFIYLLPQSNIPKQIIWYLQPVHNIFLLILSEGGFLAIALAAYLIVKRLLSLLKNRSSMAIVLILFLVTGFFDHYWLTLQQNELLLSFVTGLSFNEVYLSYGQNLLRRRSQR